MPGGFLPSGIIRVSAFAKRAVNVQRNKVRPFHVCLLAEWAFRDQGDSESFSEDPFLAGRLAAGFVLGVQSTGVGACLKHYACNNEEIDRSNVNVRLDERALREIYLPAFEAGVTEGRAWTVMSAYNKVNGYFNSANSYLLHNVLKEGWRFDGMVMSDWGGVHSVVGTIVAGNDLEMPGPDFLTRAHVEKALELGRINEAQIDEADRRILRTIIRSGLLDGPMHPKAAVVGSAEHRALALTGAEQGMVLLKNEQSVLPLDAGLIKSIAVIGPCASQWQLGGDGSPSVPPVAPVSPLERIRRRLGKAVQINYVEGTRLDVLGEPISASAFSKPDGSGPGLIAEYFTNENLSGPPALTRVDKDIQFDWNKVSPDPRIPRTNFSARWSGKLTAPVSGSVCLTVTVDDGCRVYLDGKLLINQWIFSPMAQTALVNLVSGQRYDLRMEYRQLGGDAYCRLGWILPGKSNSFADAVRAASQSDAAVVIVGTGSEGEGSDRASMALPGEQDDLIRAVAVANKRTIVVLNNGGPVLMQTWLDQVPAVLEAFFPGEEGGKALAALLFGDANPSGKLPDTVGKRREDYPDAPNFPGTKGAVNYAEGIYVGYRHFDKAAIEPLFPFGYGLSYTTFRYDDLQLSSPSLSPDGTVAATLAITNTGSRGGAEVVELYIHDPQPHIDKPMRELKAFEKVWLEPGQTKSIRFELTPRALAYCDVAGKQWKADAGAYEVEVGASSRDIRQTAPLRLMGDFTQPIPGMEPQIDLAANFQRDLALGCRATASSSESPDHGPENAVDGDDSTRWSSAFSDPQWIAVDFGKPRRLDAVSLNWEAAYASQYAIQTSTDGQNWTDVYYTTDGMGGLDEIKFNPVTARWVRMFGQKRETQWGYSLYSFQVFGTGQ
jgi:beta-glucosidase